MQVSGFPAPMPTAAAVAAAAVTAKITAMDAVPVSIHDSSSCFQFNSVLCSVQLNPV